MNADIKKQIEAAKRQSRKQEREFLKQFPDLLTKKRGRHNSTRPVFDGIKFGSGYELEIYKDNKLDPNIDIVEMHPVFPLIPEFCIDGKRFTESIYTADQLVFVKYEGREEVWEVKGPGTEKETDYRLRRQLFLFLYADIVFREIIFNKRGKTTTRKEKVYEVRTRTGSPGYYPGMHSLDGTIRKHEPVPGSIAEDRKHSCNQVDLPAWKKGGVPI